MNLIELLKRKDSLLTVYCAKVGLRDYIKKTCGLDFSYRNHIYLNNTWFIDEDEDNALLKILSTKNKSFLIKMARSGYKFCNDLRGFSDKIKRTSLDGKSINELKEIYLNYVERYKLASSFLQPPLIVEMMIMPLIEKELEKKIDPSKDYAKFKKYVFVLTSAKKESAVAEEQKELLKVAASINNTARLPIDKIKKHAEKYGWMNIHCFFGKEHDAEHYISRIKEIKNAKKQLEEIETKGKEFEEERKKILEEIKPSKDFLELIRLMQEYAYFRNYRRDAYSISEANIRGLFEEIGKRLKISYEDVICLADFELVDFIKTKNKKYIQLINERKQEFAVIGEEARIYSGKELEKIKTKYKFLEQKVKDVKEIKGDIACGGVARGITRVVIDTKELNMVKKGDILITNMTTPEYVVAMAKSAAIVTDRGGVLCHAAIVSREMGKPCIIGTKIATNLLKDGDLVEVDANIGIVKIIKRAK